MPRPVEKQPLDRDIDGDPDEIFVCAAESLSVTSAGPESWAVLCERGAEARQQAGCCSEGRVESSHVAWPTWRAGARTTHVATSSYLERLESGTR